MSFQSCACRLDYLIKESLDGDGYDDYLYVNHDGAVIMWRNLQTVPLTWGSARLVAKAPAGVNGAQVQFADTNGDGRVDYVVVDGTNGDTRTWLNQRFRDDGSISWASPTTFAGRKASPSNTVKVADVSVTFQQDMRPSNFTR